MPLGLFPGSALTTLLKAHRTLFSAGQGASKKHGEACVIGTDGGSASAATLRSMGGDGAPALPYKHFVLQVPAVYKSGSSGATDATAAAVCFQVPDGSISKGNVRGVGAVDLQQNRTSAASVASGSYSFSAGQDNIASGAGSIAIGFQNASSGTASTVSIGYNNTSNGNSNGSVAIGGFNTASNSCGVAIGAANTANGTSYSVAIGRNNTSSANYSCSLGGFNVASGVNSVAIGYNASTQSKSKLSYASNAAIAGYQQTSITVLRRQSVDATPVVLTTDASAAGANTIVGLQNTSTYAIHGLVVGRQATTGDSVGWQFYGVIRRGANAASTALVAAVTPTLIAADTGASTWACAVTADATLGGLQIAVTGENSKTIDWVATVYATEIIA